MIKITCILARSVGFTCSQIRDRIPFPLPKDASLSLIDIDPEYLEFV